MVLGVPLKEGTPSIDWSNRIVGTACPFKAIPNKLPSFVTYASLAMLRLMGQHILLGSLS